jgi:hypothetical protein
VSEVFDTQLFEYTGLGLYLIVQWPVEQGFPRWNAPIDRSHVLV